jgi:hypothetical protein
MDFHQPLAVQAVVVEVKLNLMARQAIQELLLAELITVMLVVTETVQMLKKVAAAVVLGLLEVAQLILQQVMAVQEQTHFQHGLLRFLLA